MSELKAFTFSLGRYTEDGYPCVVAVDDEDNPRLASDEKFYLKSEADKVIAELEDRLQAANEQIENLINSASSIMLFQDRVKDDKCAELRHQKYKRCLAMAEWCNANCMHTVLLIGHKITPHWEWRIKTNYWYKWRKIWFELCKKFKEGNRWRTQTNL